MKPAALIVLLGASLRLHGLGDVFPVEEEFQQIYQALHPKTLAEFLSLMRQNPHLHLLLDPLTLFIMGRAGGSLFWLRLPSLIWGILSVAGIIRLGGRARSPRAGLAAGLLLSVSLLHIDWSRRADFYSALSALSIWTTDAFFRMREDPRRWKPYCLWATAFLYAHPYAAIVGALHGAFLALEKKPDALKSYFRAGALALLAFSPWLLYSFSASVDDSVYDFSAVPGNLSLGAFLARIPLYLGQAPEAGPFRTWGFSKSAALSALYLFLYLDSLRASLSRGADPLLRFSHAAVIVGIAAVAGLDLWTRYYFSHRQLLWVLPFYLLAVSDGAERWLDKLSLRGAEGLAALGLLSLALPVYAQATHFQEERTRDENRIVAEVERRARPGDVLGFQHDGLLMSFLYYFDRSAFSACPDMRLIGRQNAHLTYLIPEGYRARRGRADLEVKVLPDERKDRLWIFRGGLYDLWVYPPRED